jgi:hypothetical protein
MEICHQIFFFIRATSESILNPDPSLGNQETSVVDPDSFNPDPDPAFQGDTDPVPDIGL